MINFKKQYNSIFMIFSLMFLYSCAMQETPRDALSVSTTDTKTLTAPIVIDSDKNFIDIRYAQMSIGFSQNCNPNRIMKDELNECAKLPENVKTIAINHCRKFNKNAIFLGNKSNLLQMTISKFKCE